MKVPMRTSLPHDDVEWYNEEYPSVPLSATLSLLLHAFRSIHEDVGLTPKRAARDAARETKELIDEGIFEEKEESED